MSDERLWNWRAAFGLVWVLVYASASAAQTPVDQGRLKVNTSITESTLRFDWPVLQIGVGSYEEGPTGLTIFKFANRATAVVDVRGGGPGTVNTDVLRLGYDGAFTNAIVFSGGSAYGEETITAVQAELKRIAESDGRRGYIGLTAGAIIDDLAEHRLNWIYPDQRLAREALHQLRSGVFPLGAQGAGRMAMQGSFFGCGAHSGQGGAFRQVGDIKIAAFSVVNAIGAVVDRTGKLVKCHRNAAWGAGESISDLLARVGTGALSAESSIVIQKGRVAAQGEGLTRATTVSLVVTNRKMSASELQRLAVQVHTSMARAIQPFSTVGDGDTLYAVSTQEVDVPQERLSNLHLNTMAGELMWDAILASVPSEPSVAPFEEKGDLPPRELRRFAGSYDFGGEVPIDIIVKGSSLAIGIKRGLFFDIPEGTTALLRGISVTEFYIPGRYQIRVRFTDNESGDVVGAIINPGPWQQIGARLK